MKTTIGILLCVVIVALLQVPLDAQTTTSCPNIALTKWCVRCTSANNCAGGAICCPNGNNDGRLCCMRAIITKITTTKAPARPAPAPAKPAPTPAKPAPTPARPAPTPAKPPPTPAKPAPTRAPTPAPTRAPTPAPAPAGPTEDPFGPSRRRRQAEANPKPGICPSMSGPWCGSCTWDSECRGMQRCCPAGYSGRKCCFAVLLD